MFSYERAKAVSLRIWTQSQNGVAAERKWTDAWQVDLDDVAMLVAENLMTLRFHKFKT